MDDILRGGRQSDDEAKSGRPNSEHQSSNELPMLKAVTKGKSNDTRPETPSHIVAI